MKRLRRAVFVLVVGALVAAIPVSALATEDLLRTTVVQAESQFDNALTQAIANGLDPTAADQLMWRNSQLTARKPSAWWQAPAVSHGQLSQLNQLRTELAEAYANNLADRRVAYTRNIRSWSALLAQGRSAGLAVDDFGTGLRFARYGQEARTPNDFQALSEVLAAETTQLSDRLASFHSAQDQAAAALKSARALLSSAGQYSQLDLADFGSQVSAAATDLNAIHTAEGFQPVIDRLHQTDVAVQRLLDARVSAINQLSDTRATLARAQSVGADLGNHVDVINGLAWEVAAVGNQAAFQSLTAQLAQQKQALANAIWLKQQEPVASGYVGGGKVIVVSISRQSLTAYQNGTAVLTTSIATGRPALATPTGTYHIFAKYSPYKFVSPWPTSSPYWYASAWSSYAMEFIGGGYFIHDAPWRSWYGPGANTYNGTHGCVNVPASPMSFLYGWAPIGTTVIVQY